jgi:hypothetical protein
MPKLPAHQEQDLLSVDDRMARVYRRAFQKMGGKLRFDGARDVEEELEHMRTGKSRIKKDPYNSTHVIGPKRLKATGIDVYPTGPGLDLDEPETYANVRSAMHEAALEEGVKIINGGESWGWDWPHWQLA